MYLFIVKGNKSVHTLISTEKHGWFHLKARSLRMPTILSMHMQPILRRFSDAVPALPLKEGQEDTPEIGKRQGLPGANLCRLCSRLHAQPIGTTRLGLFMSLAYFAIGFSPITALAIAIIVLLSFSV